MTGERLYNSPDQTLDVLREVTSGASTTEDLADSLDCVHRTAMNKVHDPVILGLIIREDGQLSVSDDARRVVQLQETTPLENPFRELAGVAEIMDRIEDEPASVEDIGRIISFDTGSDAAAESAFKSYGRVYAKWIDYLELGNYSDGFVAKGEIDKRSKNLDPLENPLGASYPRVKPQKVFEVLPKIAQQESHQQLEESTSYSDRELSKTLSTCYGLGLAESTHHGPQLTERGREVQQATIGNRKKIIREGLIEVPLVQAYCDRAPDEEFENAEVIKQISEEYAKGWSDVTIQTRATRLYSWLLFTELFEEKDRGVLEPRKSPDTTDSALT